jgi:hypothetical protein
MADKYQKVVNLYIELKHLKILNLMYILVSIYFLLVCLNPNYFCRCLNLELNCEQRKRKFGFHPLIKQASSKKLAGNFMLSACCSAEAARWAVNGTRVSKLIAEERLLA